MWKVIKMQQELGLIEEEKEALEEEKVPAGNVPPVPMLSTRAKMEKLRKARIQREKSLNLEHNPQRMASKRKNFSPQW